MIDDQIKFPLHAPFSTCDMLIGQHDVSQHVDADGFLHY